MNCKLLLIDNTTAITNPWKKVLNANFLTSEAVGGFEAITKLKSETYDLIIVNISLSDLNGVDAIRKIRDKFYFIPIIVLHAKSDNLYLKQVKTYGIQDVLALPVDVKLLIIAISRLLPACKLNEKSNGQQHKENDEQKPVVKEDSHVNIEEKFYEGLSAVAAMRYDNAIEIYKFILQQTNIKHESWLRYVNETYFQLGQCYANIKEYEISNQYFLTFISKAPNHIFVKETLLYLGKNYETMQNITKASYFYQKVLNTRPFDSFTTQARKFLTKMEKKV